MKEPDGIRGLVPSREFGRLDTVYTAYLDKLDPRNNERVLAALEDSKDERFTTFLARIQDGRFKTANLATIAKACNISLKQFQSWWQKESTQQAIAVAQVSSVKIAEDMANDARTQDTVCSRCDGLKFVAAPSGLDDYEIPGYRCIEEPSEKSEGKWIRTCPACLSLGTIKKPGDQHARDRIMEMSGIIQKGKGGINIIQNFSGMTHTSIIEDLDDKMTIDGSAELVP